jgi:hypothetical protein
LDDWLDFAEALLGRQDIKEGTLGRTWDNLTELSAHEEEIQDAIHMDMDQVWRLGERFPWLDTVHDIAGEQGFFHWELRFASVFAEGGFDLQVGNPPWVRPTWEENSVMAELEPWFELAVKPPVEVHKERRRKLLESGSAKRFYLSEMINQTVKGAFFANIATYDLLAGTQPDLYRAFMCRTWRSAGRRGVVGLLHPDTHFGGSREGALRAAAYHRLRIHANFENAANWAFEGLGRTQGFGMHIYADWQDVSFLHLSQLYSIVALSLSLTHDGKGEIPGQKKIGTWDRRPHKSRVIHVDSNLLTEWNRLAGDADTPADLTALLYPITVNEQGAISVLASYGRRFAVNSPWLSSGYHEKTAKDTGIIRWEVGRPASGHETILQGTHFGISTPYAKQPGEPFLNAKNWVPWDLGRLPENAIPRTTYVRACDISEYRTAQDSWNGRPYTDYYRMIWRAMIDTSHMERSLYVALVPPGPAHVHALMSAACGSLGETVLSVGFWSGLPLDYLLRITGRGHLQVAEALRMPAPTLNHPLAAPLMVRTLRLNCLTDMYGKAWAELCDPKWLARETWAASWLGVAPLVSDSSFGIEWNRSIPLRTERERRAALVEIDALVAVWLGMSVDQLVTVYNSRYAILVDREDETWFDSAGRKIAADPYAFGYGQTREHWEQFQKYLEDPEQNPVPDGYTPPFYKADRIAEYRQAHAAFTERMKGAAS